MKIKGFDKKQDWERERAALRRTCQSYEKEITELKKEKQALLKEIDHWTNWVDEYRKEKQALEQALQGWKTKFEFCKVQKDMERKALRDKIQQIFIDAVQHCSNCYATQGECEMKILRTNDKERCCEHCWHVFVNQQQVEEKVLAVLDADIHSVVVTTKHKQPSDGNNSLPQLIEPSEAALHNPNLEPERLGGSQQTGVGAKWKHQNAVEGAPETAAPTSSSADSLERQAHAHRPPTKPVKPQGSEKQSGKSRSSGVPGETADTLCTCGHSKRTHNPLTGFCGLCRYNEKKERCLKFTPAHGGTA